MSNNLQVTNSQVTFWIENEQNQYILLFIDFGWFNWDNFDFDPFAGMDDLFPPEPGQD